MSAPSADHAVVDAKSPDVSSDYTDIPDATTTLGDGATADSGDDGAPTVYGAITSASLWSTFDTTTVTANAELFAGAVFDGRCLYLVPSHHGFPTSPSLSGSFHSLVTRFDSTSSFTNLDSWATFDTSTVTPASTQSRRLPRRASKDSTVGSSDR